MSQDLTPEAAVPAPGAWQRIRAVLAGRRARHGGNAVVLTAAVLGILVVLNVVVARFDLRWDLTARNEFTLSEQTREVLSRLDQPIHVIVFAGGSQPADQRVKDLLAEYQRRATNFSVEYVDPEQNPSLARKYNVESFGTLVFESNGRTSNVMGYELFGPGPHPDAVSFTGEQAFTRAILNVTRQNRRAVYLVEGHGEATMSGQLWRASEQLKGEGYDVKALNLAQAGQIPADAQALVIAGPQRDISARERGLIADWLKGDGRLIALVDPAPPGRFAELGTLVGEWGVRLQDAIAVDPKRSYFFDPLAPVPEYEYHDVTRQLSDKKLAMVLPRARALTPVDNPPGGLKVTGILRTSADAWGETDLQGDRVARDAKDLKGPLTLAMAVTKEERPKLLVAGSASFVTGDSFTFQGNADFFLNAVNWLTGETNQITIRPKTIEFNRLFLTPDQARMILYTTVFIVPALFLALGGAVWWRRRAA